MASPSKQSQPQATVSPLLVRMASQPQIEFELDFFASLLERRPDFLEALKVHAKNLAHVRRHNEGLQYDFRITRLKPHDSLARYNLACSLALTRHYDAAIAELRQAIELGYRDFAFIRHDRDLDSIRRDPRFRAMLREFDRKKR